MKWITLIILFGIFIFVTVIISKSKDLFMPQTQNFQTQNFQCNVEKPFTIPPYFGHNNLYLTPDANTIMGVYNVNPLDSPFNQSMSDCVDICNSGVRYIQSFNSLPIMPNSMEREWCLNECAVKSTLIYLGKD